MCKIWDLLKKGLALGTIEPDNAKQKHQNSKVTNKILLKELVEHFNARMEDLSVGKRLLYPMSFNILMHPDDYNQTKESLPFVLPEVVAAFYAAIKQKRDEFVNGVNYANPATYWFFQFSACQIGEQNGEENIIKRGKIVTTANLTTFDIRKAQQQGGERLENNVQLSVKCQNSKTDENNINMDALLGMEILSEGSYSFNFDKNLNEDTSLIIASSNLSDTGWATLHWTDDRGSLSYPMRDTYIDITNAQDSRNARNVCHIHSSAVQKSHVQIKYDSATQTFMLAAYAKTRLNTREVAISSAGNPQWINLPKFNSKIFLNDTISIEFNANPELV